MKALFSVIVIVFHVAIDHCSRGDGSRGVVVGVWDFSFLFLHLAVLRYLSLVVVVYFRPLTIITQKRNLS